MSVHRLLAVLVTAALLGPAALAGAKEPINTRCPISKEPVVASAGTIEHDGHAIGLCCPGCRKAFLAWDESRRDAYVAMTMRGQTARGNQPRPAASQPAAVAAAPYPLDACPVSGGKLDSMGDPVVRTYDGREVRFCCGGCIRRFEANKAHFFEKIDDLIIKDQRRYYPTDKCVVSGEPLTENGKDVATNMIVGNRLLRLCCKGCVRRVKADPRPFIEKLDKAAAEAQRADYPLDTCVVAGGKLGSMGTPTEMVVAGRLMRFCCAGCQPKVKTDPVKYLAVVDEAWKARGRFAAAP